MYSHAWPQLRCTHEPEPKNMYIPYIASWSEVDIPLPKNRAELHKKPCRLRRAPVAMWAAAMCFATRTVLSNAAENPRLVVAEKHAPWTPGHVVA